MARRFVAGESLSDAIDVARSLSERGLTTSLAHLGEHVASESEAAHSRDEIRRLIQALGKNNLPSTISAKLTQLGLSLDYELCMNNMLRLAREGSAQNVYIRIDMEDSQHIDQTLSIHHALGLQGLTNVGLVFQSSLFRSAYDIRTAVTKGTTVRIVKGAYMEPESISYHSRSDVNENFDRLSMIALEATLHQGGISISADGRTPPDDCYRLTRTESDQIRGRICKKD